MEPLDSAGHILFTPTAHGSSCVWTGDTLTEETLVVLIADPDKPAFRVSMSLGGLSGMTVAHATSQPTARDEQYALSPSEHVTYNPNNDGTHTCIECLEEIASAAPVVAFRQHTTGGHETSSVVYCHPSCLPALCDRLSVVWEHTDKLIGDLL